MARPNSKDWRAKDVLTPPEVCGVLGLSRPSVYAALRAGEIASFRIGGRILVPVAAIKALIDQPASG